MLTGLLRFSQYSIVDGPVGSLYFQTANESLFWGLNIIIFYFTEARLVFNIHESLRSADGTKKQDFPHSETAVCVPFETLN